jgi:hypothetical protein
MTATAVQGAQNAAGACSSRPFRRRCLDVCAGFPCVFEIYTGAATAVEEPAEEAKPADDAVSRCSSTLISDQARHTLVRLGRS